MRRANVLRAVGTAVGVAEIVDQNENDIRPRRRLGGGAEVFPPEKREARDDEKARVSAEFSLKKFHTYALNIGPMGLDPFSAELANRNGK